MSSILTWGVLGQHAATDPHPSTGLHFLTFENLSLASKKAPWLEALAAEPDNMSSVSRTQMVEGENRLLLSIYVVRTFPHMCPPEVNTF